MRIIECVQGSPEWHAARIGIPTASRFHEIITPKTRKPSGSQGRYVAHLVAEWALGASLTAAASPYMERGKEFEAEAVAWYEMDRNVAVRRVGFCLRDDGAAGCSPDGLVGDDGGLEIKTLGAEMHSYYLLNPERMESEYACQVQGNLYITGRSWWDLLAYHPTMPRLIRRVKRDEAFIADLERELDGFIRKLDRAKASVTARAEGAAP